MFEWKVYRTKRASFSLAIISHSVFEARNSRSFSKSNSNKSYIFLTSKSSSEDREVAQRQLCSQLKSYQKICTFGASRMWIQSLLFLGVKSHYGIGLSFGRIVDFEDIITKQGIVENSKKLPVNVSRNSNKF